MFLLMLMSSVWWVLGDMHTEGQNHNVYYCGMSTLAQHSAARAMLKQ